MKKIWLLLMTVLMIVLLSSCSAYDGDPMQNIDSELYFNWSTLTYTQLERIDIFNQASQPIDDLVVLHQVAFNEPLDASIRLAYENLLNILLPLSIDAHINVGTLLNKRSSELQTLAKQYDYTLALSDIVVFNELKVFKEDVETLDVTLSKVDYFEARTAITLTIEQKQDIDLLQLYFIMSNEDQALDSFSAYTYEQLEALFMMLPDAPTEEEQIALASAYDLMMILFMS